MLIALASTGFPQQILDAATKVTSQWGLGGFALAAVVAILLGAKQKRSSGASRFPIVARIVLVIAIVVPITAWAVLVLNPYRVSVVVLDANTGVVSDARVISSVGGQGNHTQGEVQFEIPMTFLPDNRTATFFADKGNLRGEKSVQFRKARSISVRIDLAAATLTQVTTPETRWCAQSPYGAPYQTVIPFYPHHHFNGKTEGGDALNPGRGWHIEWEAPGNVYDVSFRHDGSHMERLDCGRLPDRPGFAYCHGWKNGGDFQAYMDVKWKQPCETGKTSEFTDGAARPPAS